MSMIFLLPILGACSSGLVELDGVELDGAELDGPCGENAAQSQEAAFYLDSVRDGVAVAVAADQGTAQVQASLRELRVLTLLAAGGLRSPDELESYEAQAAVHRAAIERLALDTHLGDVALLDGSTESVQVWVESACSQSPLELPLVPMSLEALGVDHRITDADQAAEDLWMLDQALEEVALARSGYSASAAVFSAYEPALAQEAGEVPATFVELDLETGDAEYAQDLLDAQLDNVRRAEDVLKETLKAQDSVQDLLSRMLALAEEAADPERSDSERWDLQEEVAAYGRGVDKVWALHEEAVQLRFRDSPFTALVGQTNESNNRVVIDIQEISAGMLGVDTGSMDLSRLESATASVLNTSEAIERVEDSRSTAKATLQVLRVIEEDLVGAD